jgi:hypothetical protein
MSNHILDDFERLFGKQQDEYYPGSKRKRRESQEVRHERLVEERRVAREDEPWDAHPLEVYIGGARYEMFRVGALAKALGRESVTIRAWMRKGWLPRNSYQTKARVGTRGDAGLRLWTRAQIEGITKIAQEEGLLDENPPRLVETNFTARVIAAWMSWR